MKLLSTQLVSIQQNAQILRAYPLFSMALANKVNSLVAAVLPSIKEVKDQSEIFEEKTSAIKIMEAGPTKSKALEGLNKDIIKANAKAYEVNITPIKSTEFVDADNKAIEFSGEKEVQQNHGLVKFNYRDAYFELINVGVIV